MVVVPQYVLPVNTWYWSQLGDIARILKTSPSDVISRYWPLSMTAYRHKLTFSSDGVTLSEESVGILVTRYSQFEVTGNQYLAERAFFPAPWTVAVVNAHKKGYISAKLYRPRKNEPKGADWLTRSGTDKANDFCVGVGIKALATA